MTRVSDRLLVQRVDDQIVVMDEPSGHEIVFDLEDAVRVQHAIGNLLRPIQKWRVQDNMTGSPVTQEFGDPDTASYYCRALNTPSAGGRFGVYTNAPSGQWERDLS